MTLLVCDHRYMHGTKADKLYDSTQLLDVTAQLDLGECGVQEVNFYHQHKNNVDFVFVDHPVYHRAGALSFGSIWFHMNVFLRPPVFAYEYPNPTYPVQKVLVPCLGVYPRVDIS